MHGFKMSKLLETIRKIRKQGDLYVHGTGVGLAIALIMIMAMLYVILVKGLGFFWPARLVLVETREGQQYLGELKQEVTRKEQLDTVVVWIPEIQLKIGNRDVYGLDFIWLKVEELTRRTYPEQALTIERLEYGNFYGFPVALQLGSRRIAADEQGFNDSLHHAFQRAVQYRERIRKLENTINHLMDPVTAMERELTLLRYRDDAHTPAVQEQIQRLEAQIQAYHQKVDERYRALTEEYQDLKTRNAGLVLQVTTADGQEKAIPLARIVRYYYPNQLSVAGRLAIYGARLWEFVSAEPRESNTEGGVFPAIFGTVLMVIIMSAAVVPLGVMAALYLTEYARQGPVIRLIRISINNLAGVPSIVMGMFGLGFFIYVIGGSIDQLFFADRLPTPTFGTGGILWASLTLALLTLPVVVVATEEGLRAVPQANKEGALALGATKWLVIRRIVLPNAMPGILTGLILAISRGAGEVAPLMITGVVKLAPNLPIDGTFPFLHLERKFMHLGFHIYDVGFQSPNVEAAEPMVYATALLLILIVIGLNLVAIRLRNNLRKKYKMSVF